MENRSHLVQKINGFMEEDDLIVLPEMFSSGFTMNPKAVAISAIQQAQKSLRSLLVFIESLSAWNRFRLLPGAPAMLAHNEA